MPKSPRTSPAPSGQVSTSDVSPLDGEDFLEQNRANREKLRVEAQAKDERAKDDRTPGRTSTTRRFTVRGSRGVWVALVSLICLAAVLAATTGYFAYSSRQAHSEVDATQVSTDDGRQAMDVARKYAVELTTYDPTDYGDLDRRIRQIATPAFADRYIASSADARQGNAAARGNSRATATEAGLQSISSDKAVVLVALDQTVSSPQVEKQVPEGIPYQSRVKITLVHRDGRWQLDDLAAV